MTPRPNSALAQLHEAWEYYNVITFADQAPDTVRTKARHALQQWLDTLRDPSIDGINAALAHVTRLDASGTDDFYAYPIRNLELALSPDGKTLTAKYAHPYEGDHFEHTTPWPPNPLEDIRALHALCPTRPSPDAPADLPSVTIAWADHALKSTPHDERTQTWWTRDLHGHLWDAIGFHTTSAPRIHAETLFKDVETIRFEARGFTANNREVKVRAGVEMHIQDNGSTARLL